MKRQAGDVPEGWTWTWDRSEKVVHHRTGYEKVVPAIPWRRPYIFICPISFRDPIDTSRFRVDVEQKKYGIKLI
jgi:hypothetical protein